MTLVCPICKDLAHVKFPSAFTRQECSLSLIRGFGVYPASQIGSQNALDSALLWISPAAGNSQALM
jgi:hypothetical protein